MAQVMVCDLCRQNRAIGVHVETGRQFSGSCGTDPVIERVDLCHQCAISALKWLLKKADYEVAKEFVKLYRKAV